MYFLWIKENCFLNIDRKKKTCYTQKVENKTRILMFEKVPIGPSDKRGIRK